jgi:hypothetical protein
VGGLANAEGVSLLGLGVWEILKSEASQSPGNAIKPASFLEMFFSGKCEPTNT